MKARRGPEMTPRSTLSVPETLLSLLSSLSLTLGLTLLRLSELVRAMGSESLLRRRRERGDLEGEERDAVVILSPLLFLLLLYSRA